MIITYDIRMKNQIYLVLPTASMHTIEHLFATISRNSEYEHKIIYFGPRDAEPVLLLVRDMKPEDAIALIQRIMTDIANYEGEIPGNTAVECGNYLEHDLKMQKSSKEFLPYIAN
ncbi:MAG: S-ribosylhomocysteine lyase [Acutalibacteraceae bacterium]